MEAEFHDGTKDLIFREVLDGPGGAPSRRSGGRCWTWARTWGG